MNAYTSNSLRFNIDLCSNCVMCCSVCPHAVFARKDNIVSLSNPESCMECGACQLNCPTKAIEVDSGVGCASAMIYAALTGKKETTCGETSLCSKS